MDALEKIPEGFENFGRKYLTRNGKNGNMSKTKSGISGNEAVYIQ